MDQRVLSLCVHGLRFMLVEGQIHGGVQIGIGYALYETSPSVPPEADSLPFTVPKAPDMPPIRVVLGEENEPTGALGRQGCGRDRHGAVAVAVINAVNDALGTGLTHLPPLPDRVLAVWDDRVHADQPPDIAEGVITLPPLPSQTAVHVLGVQIRCETTSSRHFCCAL